MNNSPLRYPGGKAIMTSFFADLFRINGMRHITYAEPYAGGAGAAINLLMQGAVENIIINDANIGVFSFWHYLLADSELFIKTIKEIPITIEEWHRQRKILKESTEPSFELGIATFFMSRTNRSGVISGGPIGGVTEEKQQLAKYKIDCRFNKINLLSRLQEIVAHKNHIMVSNLDALDFLRELNDCVFVYLDPPYYEKGKCLYMNHYTDKDHYLLAEYLQNTAPFSWILSYDDVPQIRKLYSAMDLYKFPLKYTVEIKRVGFELLTHSQNIILPENPQIKRSQKGFINIEKIKYEDNKGQYR